MPTSTMREDSLYPLPENQLFPAELIAVTVRTIKFVHKKGDKVGMEDSFDLWVWEFRITGGDFEGLKAKGETESELTTLTEARGRSKPVRPWAETLLGRTMEVGEELNTDDLLALPCQITVVHEEPRAKADGGFFYSCPVDDVLPASRRSNRDNPPF